MSNPDRGPPPPGQAPSKQLPDSPENGSLGEDAWWYWVETSKPKSELDFKKRDSDYEAFNTNVPEDQPKQAKKSNDIEISNDGYESDEEPSDLTPAPVNSRKKFRTQLGHTGSLHRYGGKWVFPSNGRRTSSSDSSDTYENMPVCPLPKPKQDRYQMSRSASLDEFSETWVFPPRSPNRSPTSDSVKDGGAYEEIELHEQGIIPD